MLTWGVTLCILTVLVTPHGSLGADLRVLGMLPMSGSSWPGGASCIPPIDMALEDVNNFPGLLDGYNLTYNYVDSACTAGASVYNLFKALNNDPPYCMLLGPSCSVAAQASGQVSYLWNLTQLSYGGSSPVLSDRNRFPYFYRMGTPDQKYIKARIDLMKKYNWKKVATIHQAVEFFSVVADDFIRELHENNISIITQEIFLHDPYTRVQNLKDNDARIIYAAMYEDRVRALLCAAYKIGLYGPKIVWIFPGWYSDLFWKKKDDNIDCTLDQMSIAADGAFTVVSVYMNPNEERGLANITAKEFTERFHSHPLYDNSTETFDFISGRCYDHIWLASLALNCTINTLEEIGHNKTLDMFTYADADINLIIFECMAGVSLTGVSGRISFATGDPDKIVKLERIQGDRRQLIAYYRQDKRPTHYEFNESAIKWLDGVIPRDSTMVTNREMVIPPLLYVLMCTLAGLGCLLAIAFLMFNIVYRDNRIVKMSSPNINNVLLLGCVICYATIFLNTLETNHASVCKARVFTFTIGFTLTFGSLFSKTWRVYRIFTNKKLLRRSIKDIQLLGIIAVFVAVVMSVLILWQLLEPYVMVVQHLEKEIYTIGNDEEVRPYVRMCRSAYSLYFGWAIYVIEGALLAFGAFLAWETRHVKIEALNDSHQIGMCVYNVVILSAVGLTLSLLLDQQVVMLYGVTSGCLIIGTTLTQLVIFIPKVHAVHTAVDIAPVTTTGGRSGTSKSATGTGISHTANTIPTTVE